MVSKELADSQDNYKINAVISGIQDREKEHTEEIAKLKKQIDDLKLSQGTTDNAIGNSSHPPTNVRNSNNPNRDSSKGRGRTNFRKNTPSYERGPRPPTPFNRNNRSPEGNKNPTNKTFRPQYNNNASNPVTQTANSERYRRDANGRPICAACGKAGHLAKRCRRRRNYQ